MIRVAIRKERKILSVLFIIHLLLEVNGLFPKKEVPPENQYFY
jgi:hypothetical protein